MNLGPVCFAFGFWLAAVLWGPDWARYAGFTASLLLTIFAITVKVHALSHEPAPVETTEER